MKGYLLLILLGLGFFAGTMITQVVSDNRMKGTCDTYHIVILNGDRYLCVSQPLRDRR